MKIKYSPMRSSRETIIKRLSENAIEIDGELHEFDERSVIWPNIREDSKGAITEAHRVAGELYLTVLCRYTGSSRPAWDTGDYQEIAP